MWDISIACWNIPETRWCLQGELSGHVPASQSECIPSAGIKGQVATT